MKKAVVYLLTGVMMFVLAACGKDGNGSQESSPMQSGSGSQSGSENQSSAGDQDNESNSTAGDGAGESDENPFGAESGWSEEMESLKAAVVEELGDDYWPNMALDPELLEAVFGITGEMYEDYLAEMPMISANVDTLVVVKAKAGQADAAESTLNAYRDVQINNSLQYPMNLSKVQASVVEKIGDYVLFVQLGGDVMDEMEKGDEAAIAYCQDVNQRVVDTLRQKLEQ